MVQRCANCGNLIREGVVTCPYCGATMCWVKSGEEADYIG